ARDHAAPRRSTRRRYSASVASSLARSEKCASTRLRPARAIASAEVGSPSSARIASASAPGSRGGTSSPGSPGRTTSGMPSTPAAPGADADLRDESIVPAEAELAPDGPAVHAGMEALEVGAGVNDLDLAGGDAAGDEAALDRLADGHDRLHASRGIADTPDPGHRKAHAAVEDEQRAAAHGAGEEGQGSRTTFMGVSDLDAMAPDDARQP